MSSLVFVLVVGVALEAAGHELSENQAILLICTGAVALIYDAVKVTFMLDRS